MNLKGVGGIPLDGRKRGVVEVPRNGGIISLIQENEVRGFSQGKRSHAGFSHLGKKRIMRKKHSESSSKKENSTLLYQKSESRGGEGISSTKGSL